jgi:hypothetical protein
LSYEVSEKVTNMARKKIQKRAGNLFNKVEKLIHELRSFGEESFSIGDLEIVRTKGLYYVYRNCKPICCIYIFKGGEDI